MKLHELQPAVGSTTAPKRLGRGVGSGLGKDLRQGPQGRQGGVPAAASARASRAARRP